MICPQLLSRTIEIMECLKLVVLKILQLTLAKQKSLLAFCISCYPWSELKKCTGTHTHTYTHSPEWMKTLKTSIIVHLIYHDRNPWRYLKTWTLNLVLMILLFEHVIFYFYLNSYSPLNFHKWADHMKLEKMSNPL